MVFSDFFDHAVKQKTHTPAYQKATAPSTSLSGKKTQKKRQQEQKKHCNDDDHDSPHTNNLPAKKKKKRKRSRPPKNPATLKRQKHGPPLAEALAFSASLKDLSSQKRLEEALDLYWDPTNDAIRDGHHGCIMVDCCARCGSIEQGEKIVRAMKEAGTHVSVETKTALLKGYAHSGMMHEGKNLFKEMCLSNAKRDRPNVRTLNTLLRGCLWTAASVTVNEKDLRNGSRPTNIAGGVVTSEEAWSLYRASQEKSKGAPNHENLFDSSSYEYSIVILCQALRCNDAASRIEEMKRTLGIEGNHVGQDHSAMETLAVCLLSLARSYALLGRVREGVTAAQNSLDAADKATELLRHVDGNNENQNEAKATSRKMSGGGKRAWRSHGHTSTVPNTRAVSNSLFRRHRLSEIRSECTSILQWCKKVPALFSPNDLAFYMLTRLLYFSGGGTTEMSTTRQGNSTPEATRIQSLNSVWTSFGLKATFESSEYKMPLPRNLDTLGQDDCRKVCATIGLGGASVIDEEGFIDFDRIFVESGKNVSNKSSNVSRDTKRPLCIELGAGFGDWVVTQARANPFSDYVAVELRSDRVAQTFSKAVFNDGRPPLANLCCVGAECGGFLRNGVKNGYVSTIFVNHPEPPTQTYGSQATDLIEIANGKPEPAHMLNSETLLSAASCLDEALGMLVIVTDNRWYARLICATLVKLMRSHDGLLRSMKFDGRDSGLYQIEVFPQDAKDQVFLYEGQPSLAVRHAVVKQQGASYFDRLWRSGACSHAESKKRFIISMERCQKGTRNRISSTMPRAKSGVKEKGKRKKSDAKQRRRNERRLKKRSSAT